MAIFTALHKLTHICAFCLQNFLTIRPDPSRYPNFFASTRPVPSRSQKPLLVGPWLLGFGEKSWMDWTGVEWMYTPYTVMTTRAPAVHTNICKSLDMKSGKKVEVCYF